MTGAKMIAADVIGYDGPDFIRVVGGRALYESARYNDCTPGDHVALERLETRPGMKLHIVSRWVEWDCPVEIVKER